MKTGSLLLHLVIFLSSHRPCTTRITNGANHGPLVSNLRVLSKEKAASFGAARQLSSLPAFLSKHCDGGRAACRSTLRLARWPNGLHKPSMEALGSCLRGGGDTVEVSMDDAEDSESSLYPHDAAEERGAEAEDSAMADPTMDDDDEARRKELDAEEAALLAEVCVRV